MNPDLRKPDASKVGKKEQICCGAAWCLLSLAICYATHEMLFAGTVLLAGMAAAKYVWKGSGFIAGVWIGLGLLPFIAVIACFASLGRSHL